MSRARVGEEKEPPLVSFVIPAYNGAGFLAETIDSALAQTYRRVEVVVIDDGSTDATPEVLARYGDRVVWKRQENKGLAAARNAALDLSKGEYIAWLDHDDVVPPERVSLQVAFLEEHPEHTIVAGDFSAFDDAGWTEASHAASYYSSIARRGLAGIFPDRTELSTRGLGLPSSVPDTITAYTGRIYDKLVFGNCLHPPTVMTTRAASLAVGPFEQRFGNDIDYEYVLRLAKHGPAAFLDYPLLRYRYSDHQLSGDKNMVKIALSLVSVVEHLLEIEPHRRDDPAFHRRVGEAHLRAAHALAEEDRRGAARHLVRSLSAGGLFDPEAVARTAAKLLVPRAALEAYRARRR